MKQTLERSDIVLNEFDARRLKTLILMAEKPHHNLAPWFARLRRILEQDTWFCRHRSIRIESQ